MRVSANTALSVGRDAPAARRAGGGTFSLGDAGYAAPRAAAAQLHSIGGIDALMALQGLEDATERRRRAVKKGRGALDALDALKLGLISGNLDQSALNQLRAISNDLQETTGDRSLDEVLSEIDLRVQVEIAKLSRR